MGIMTLKEVRSAISVFDMIARSQASNKVSMCELDSMKQLMEGLRFINRDVSPLLVSDWLLRCAPYIESTSKLFKLGQTPSKKEVMSQMLLNVHEFLCLVSNTEDRLALIRQVHKPNFKVEKYLIDPKNVYPDKNRLRAKSLYKMDLNKVHFVGQAP